MTYYDLNMNSKRINNCQDPSSAQDVATKNYVDLRLPLIVSTPTVPANFITTNVTGNVLTDIISVSATIVTGGIYRISGSLVIQNYTNPSSMTYASLWCSRLPAASVSPPGPARDSEMIDIDYQQVFAGVAQFLHKHLHGTALATAAQLGGAGTRTFYLICQPQFTSVVSQNPDANGTSNTFLMIERIA